MYINQVKNNKLAIEGLQVPATGVPSDVATRLRTVESRLDNLQPTGQVQLDLTTLGHRIDLLQATVSILLEVWGQPLNP